jgi:dTDP-4-amino-4,6-dideoxygalactose transaminase
LTYYREKYAVKPGSFPNASWISDASIALPVGPHLDEDDMAYIAATVRAAISELKS